VSSRDPNRRVKRERDDRIPGWLGLRIGVGLLIGAFAFLLVVFLLLGGLWLGVAVLADDEGDPEEEVEVLPDPPDAVCTETGLTLNARFGTDGPLNGVITVGPAREATYCLLQVPISVGMRDGLSQSVPVQVIDAPASYQVVVGGPASPDETNGGYTFHWANWCGSPLAAPLSVTAGLSTGALQAPIIGSGNQGETAPAPPCYDASAASTLTLLPGLDGRLIAEIEGTCAVAQLTAAPDLYGIAEGIDSVFAGGGGFIENLEGPACVLDEVEDIRLESGDGELLDAEVDIADDWDYERPLIGPDGGPWVRLTWTNWCDSPPHGPLRIVLVFSASEEFSFDVANSTDGDGLIIVPPCEDDGDGSAAGIELLP
jgi:hypothetical protein